MFRGVYFILVTVLYTSIQRFFDFLGLSFINNAWNEWWNRIDLMLANGFTSIWDRNLERIATAPMTIIESTQIIPDESIKLKQESVRTVITPIECWLTDESIDYSLFFDYKIDATEAKQALSRLLAKVPIIGGVFIQINAHQLAIDHSAPSIPFVHAVTEHIPSIDPNDCEEAFYFTKYTNGANKAMPFPANKHVFKVTMTHYQKDSLWHTLIAIGCSHALCDAEALFTLLRGWASELRGVEINAEEFDFDRRRLLNVDCKQEMDKNHTVFGKHFGNSVARNGWFAEAIWPNRRWKPRNWIWTKKQINALKEAAFRGRAGKKLKKIGRISANDVLMALHWKLNATLNGVYAYNESILCCMVINTRKWIPHRFPPSNVKYFGNGLAFLVLHEQRGKLIEMDFSEIVLRVRETVMALKAEQFEEDLLFYAKWIAANPIKYRHNFQGRWATANDSYQHNRDMMVSNLMKLDTHTMNMGRGNPFCVRFNHRDEPTMMTYIFKRAEPDSFDFYGAFPKEYDAFFEEYDIQNPNLDWQKISKKYVKYPWIRPFFRETPCPRCIRIYPKRDCCSNRKDKKANFGFVEL